MMKKYWGNGAAWRLFIFVCAFSFASNQFAAAEIDGEAMAKDVVIHRDKWGVPHIKAKTDAGAVFGFAYTQAEDFFWQLEDSYIMSVGRYAEVNGDAGLDNDLLNRTFEIVPRAKEDYEKSPPERKAIAEAFAAGVNWYLKSHPEEEPRLLDHFEPWMTLAYERHILLSFLWDRIHLSKGDIKKNAEEWRAHVGSNAWAIAPERTKSKEAILFVNPHQPYFGFGQWVEAHMVSDEGLNISGAALFGGPLISVGHNEHLGWTHTVNEPDVADSWIETFDDPANPLNYRYDGGWRTATEWKDTITVRTTMGMEERTYTFRKTHHGPVVGKRDATHYVTGRISRLFDGDRAAQAMDMGKAKNFDEWYAAMSGLSLQMFNTVYADKEGNIFYLYNGAVPKRDPSFDWEKPVDGSDPKTEWGELHPISELPQTLNPASGYIQSCNQSPFTTTDDGSPLKETAAKYMVEERDDDKRRAKISRMILRELHDTTYEDVEKLAFDTRMYWAIHELPKYKRLFEDLKKRNPELAGKAEQYLGHLLDWDGEATLDSTQATLCADWYAQLHEGFYPAETLKPQFLAEPDKRFEALITAADRLTTAYGKWQVPWGQIHRIQRQPNVADMLRITFKDTQLSYPSPGVHGPLGVVFTVYYSPAMFGRKNRYAIVGSSFMALYQFGEKVKSKSLIQFGQSGDPASPHFMDQSKLFSEKKFKESPFYWDEVEAATVRKYHPGQEAQSVPGGGSGGN